MQFETKSHIISKNGRVSFYEDGVKKTRTSIMVMNKLTNRYSNINLVKTVGDNKAPKLTDYIEKIYGKIIGRA